MVVINPCKVIVAGGRDFNDYDKLEDCLNEVLLKYDEFDEMFIFKENYIIVSGKATGADTLGEKYAKENNLPIREFAADWKTHGKAAGPMRNKQMAEYADICICFWDGKSKGTKNMIDEALAADIELHVYRY